MHDGRLCKWHGRCIHQTGVTFSCWSLSYLDLCQEGRKDSPLQVNLNFALAHSITTTTDTTSPAADLFSPTPTSCLHTNRDHLCQRTSGSLFRPAWACAFDWKGVLAFFHRAAPRMLYFLSRWCMTTWSYAVNQLCSQKEYVTMTD